MATSGYRPVPFSNFGGGINVRDGVDVVEDNQAIDALNVTFTERGAVRQRDGYDNLTSSELTNRADSLSAFYTSSGTKQIIAGCGTRLEALTSAGAVSASLTGLSGGPWGFARIGTPNAERLYAGNGTDTLRKWDGASWTAPTATVDGVAAQTMPKARYLAIDSDSNRLVASGFATTTGGPAGHTSSPSHVYWSDPGDPETYGSNNYVQLHPGDGEAIQGIIAWRGQIFVFKESKFFVFFGEGTDSTGEPVFDYRTVEAGIGLASPRALCAGRDGVYFLSRKGVYRTQGQEPQLTSDLIDPLLVPSLPLPTFYANAGGLQIAPGSITNAAMAWHDERIYLGLTMGAATTNNRTLVLDPRYGWWSVWDIPMAALTSFRVSNADELVFAYASGLKHVGRHNSSYTNDDGTAITSRWQSGWFDYGAPFEKTVRETKLWGTGSLVLTLASDYSGAVFSENVAFAVGDTWGDGLGTDTWGDGSNTGDLWSAGFGVYESLVRRAVVGTVFSVGFQNSILDKQWAIHRAQNHLRESRAPSVHTT